MNQFPDPIPERQLTHLRKSERTIWRLFEAQAPLGPATYTFDLHLGRGIPPDPSWPDWLSEMAVTLTQRRVDVVARTDSQTWLLEIKARSGTAAIGQLLVYRSLYAIQFTNEPQPQLGVIALRDSFDMDPAYSDYNIRLFLV